MSKGIKKAMPELQFELPEVEPGLLIFYGITPEQEALVRGVVEHDVRRGDTRGPVRHSVARNVTAIHAGTTQLARIAAEFADAFTKKLKEDARDRLGNYVAHSLTATAGRFDWTGSASRTVLKERIDDARGHCVTFAVAPGRGEEKELANTLGHVAEDARNAGAYVICFVVGPPEQGRAFAGVGVDAIEIGPCDREPDASMAFAAKSLATRAFHGLGLGHVMCNVYLSHDRSRHKYERFVSEDLGTRVMWIFKGQGHSTEIIARVFNVKSRTTVMRRLKSLPPPQMRALEPRMLDLYEEHLGLDGEILADMMQRLEDSTDGPFSIRLV